MISLDPETLKKVAARIDEKAAEFRETGRRLQEAFEPKRSDTVSSQLRNLQQAAAAAQALYDVEYFVKNQIGRGKGDAKRWRDPGEKVLKDLEELRKVAKELAKGAAPSEEDQQLLEHELRLRLLRGWIKVVVGEYMYRRALRAV